MTELEQLYKEIEQIPRERLGKLLQVVQDFKQKEAITRPSKAAHEGKRELEDILADYPDGQMDAVFQKFEQDAANIPMRKFSENIAGYNGGLFKTAKEVDDYIRKERDAWDS
jgi:hypothetical protein